MTSPMFAVPVSGSISPSGNESTSVGSSIPAKRRLYSQIPGSSVRTMVSVPELISWSWSVASAAATMDWSNPGPYGPD